MCQPIGRTETCSWIILPTTLGKDTQFINEFVCLRSIINFYSQLYNLNLFIFFSFSSSERIAKKLIRHPFMMDTPHERIRYFSDVFQATESNTCVNPTAFKKTLDQDPRFQPYKNWTTTYKGHILYSNFSRESKKGKAYSGQNLFSLIAFLRHVYIHCVTTSADFEEIDEEIAQLYPGLSSHVHEIFVMKDEFY